MQVIDINECRQALEADKTVTVMINKDQGFVVRIDIKRQERLIKRYVNPQVQFDQKTFDRIIRIQAERGTQLTESDLGEMEGMIQLGGTDDFFGLGLALVEFFEDWIGFKGSFNRKDATWYLENYSDATKALGRNFRAILSQYQETHTVYERELEKN